MPTVEQIREAVEARLLELAGEASLCWARPPTSTFDAEGALQAAKRASDDVAKRVHELLARAPAACCGGECHAAPAAGKAVA